MAADGGPDPTEDKAPPPREDAASEFSRLIDDAIPAQGATLDSGHRPAGTAALSSEVASGEAGHQGLGDVGRYRLGRLLGEGGMGSVFEAEQVYPVRRRVAVKLIKLGMDTRQVVARFQAERQALAIMNHPNIARVFDAGATAQ